MLTIPAPQPSAAARGESEAFSILQEPHSLLLLLLVVLRRCCCSCGCARAALAAYHQPARRRPASHSQAARQGGAQAVVWGGGGIFVSRAVVRWLFLLGGQQAEERGAAPGRTRQMAGGWLPAAWLGGWPALLARIDPHSSLGRRHA